MSRAAQAVTLVVEFDPSRQSEPAKWDWPNVIDGPATFIKATGVDYLIDSKVAELADEFAENALYDLSDFLRNGGVRAAKGWIEDKIAEVKRGDDPFDPTGESLHNLEVARDHLTALD